MAQVLIENLWLQYPVYSARAFSVRNTILRIGTGGLLERESGQAIKVTALKDLSLRLGTGDRVGLIGHNGAGKSTLLRAVAGIYPPTTGRIEITGKVGTLFELGAGSDPDLTGWDNVQRVGRLLGMTPRQIRERMKDIEDFSELGDFLSLPVRTYSAGMQTRLMFTIATSSQPEILLIDEVFGAGDAGFQQKAVRRMHDLLAGTKVLVFASHSDELISGLCNKVLWLEHGAMRAFGPTAEVLDEYHSSIKQAL